MRITAVLSVKDEVELIGDCVEHLRRIGVSQIIAHDGGSTDGTLAKLKSYEAPPDFIVHQFDDTHPVVALAEANANNRAAIDASRPDWVLYLDADEFWIPASGRLQDCASLADADVLDVRRFNVPLTPAGAAMPLPAEPGRYAELDLFVKSVPQLRLTMQADPRFAWIRGVPLPKIMARPDSYESVRAGWHQIVPVAGREPRRCVPADLLVAHLPFTTRSRFARKLANIRRLLQAPIAQAEFKGWHWRRWGEIEEQAGVDAEFDLQIFRPGRIEKLRARGVIRSAADLFALGGD